MGIIDNAKAVADLVQKYNDIELNRKIVELEMEIVEGQRALMDMERKNQDLEQRNRELDEALTTQATLTFKKNAYYRDGDEEPYCPCCWDVEKKLVHLILTSRLEDKCPSCKNDIRVQR